MTYLPTEPSRDKARSASARLLAQASSPGPGGWCGASRFTGRRCPGLPPPHLPPVPGGERAPCHPAQGWADPSTGSRLKQVGSCPSSPGQGTTAIPTPLPPAAPHTPEAGRACLRTLLDSSAAGRGWGWWCPCGPRKGRSHRRWDPPGPPACLPPALPCLAYLW